MFIYAVITVLAAADAFYWWWADRRLRPMRRAGPWRGILAVLVGGQLLVLAWWMFLPWTLRGLGGTFWIPVTAWLYTWHLLVLPATVICVLLGYGGLGVVTGVQRLLGANRVSRRTGEPIHAGLGARGDDSDSPARAAPSEHPLHPVTGPATVYPSRRQLLGAAAALVPQVVLGGSLMVAAAQAGRLRVRRFSLAFANLPRALDGLTIAHLSDTHAGRFVREPQLERIAQATLDLNPDLVVFTGDLIDFNLADLPPAVSILRQLGHRLPMALCVGNHDLFENAREFRRRLRSAEIPLLADEKHSFTFRGQRLDVLGLDWGTPANPRDDALRAHMERTLSQHAPSTFSLLLAHHPHAYDRAAPAGVPLTLAGHTHGGQLMLTDSIGAGRAFRYWSGLYEGPVGTAGGGAASNSKLIVSNGAGNWFPVRINAPAEIVHITLRSA